MSRAAKTQNRQLLFDNIVNSLTNKHALNAINYKSYNEDRIKQSMQHFLVGGVTKYYMAKGYEEEYAEKAAYEQVLWEGTPNQTIHNRQFLGCNHRPDFEIQVSDNLEIAVEVKIGGNGTSLRSGLGQALVYSQLYDFVIYIFVDNSDVCTIKESYEKDEHKEFIDYLWDYNNIWFIVV